MNPVAWVNHLGHMTCAPCTPEPRGKTPVYPDNSALIGDSCDRCGRADLFDRSAHMKRESAWQQPIS